MARLPVTKPRLAVVMAVAGSLAAHAEGVGRSQFDEIARASIEIENSGPSLTRELPADAGSSANAGSPAAEAPATGNPLWAIPVSKLSATRDRPLFSSSRRPPTPTVAAAPTPTPPAVVKPVAPEFAAVHPGWNDNRGEQSDRNSLGRKLQDLDGGAGGRQRLWMDIALCRSAFGNIGRERPHGDARSAGTHRHRAG